MVSILGGCLFSAVAGVGELEKLTHRCCRAGLEDRTFLGGRVVVVMTV